MGETDGIQLGTVVAGRYRVQERLGEGGMGSVYRVEHVHTGQPLALKVLNPKLVENAVALERFRREARAPARINSDHVVTVTDADVAPELGGAPFLVMELLEGETFDELLRHREKLPPAEALSYLRQIGRTLDKAHGIGIVHRDIKPENLFLTRRDDGTPRVKLLDFGIARLGEATGESASKTATGEVFGTPLYMSPEQTLGRTDKISPQTDVWALGLIAHKLLTGKEPWTAQTLPHLVAQIAYEPLPVPSQQGVELGPAYDAWFARCCAREPADRYATASDAVAMLAEALNLPEPMHSSQPSSADISNRVPSIRSDTAAFAETAHADALRSMSDTLAAQVAPKKRSRELVFVAAVGLALLVAGVVFFATRTESPATSAGQPPAPEPPTTTEPVDTTPAPVPAPAPPAVPEVAPIASETPPEPTKPKSIVPAPQPPKPAPPVAKSPPEPPAPAPTPTPTPPSSAKRDPLGGRH